MTVCPDFRNSGSYASCRVGLQREDRGDGKCAYMISPAPLTPSSASSAGFGPARSLSIIVADDVPEILQLARIWLSGTVHAVTCATCGNEVIRLMKSHAFDVIVADVLMPDGDGLDVIVSAKRGQNGPRVLAISGGGKYMTADDCLRMARGIGADAVLFKPFTRDQFVGEIERLGALTP